MNKVEKKHKIVKCPTCKTEFNYYDKDTRPFCCDRCKMIDLGHWMSEGYNIPSSRPLTEEELIALEKELENENKNKNK